MSYLSKSFIYLSTTKAASGDNTLITGVAGSRIIVKELLIQNESTTETTVLIKNGSTTILRALLQGKAAISLAYQEGEELWLDAGSGLVINLSGANSHGCSVRYTIQ